MISVTNILAHSALIGSQKLTKEYVISFCSLQRPLGKLMSLMQLCGCNTQADINCLRHHRTQLARFRCPGVSFSCDLSILENLRQAREVAGVTRDL